MFHFYIFHTQPRTASKAASIAFLVLTLLTFSATAEEAFLDLSEVEYSGISEALDRYRDGVTIDVNRLEYMSGYEFSNLVEQLRSQTCHDCAIVMEDTQLLFGRGPIRKTIDLEQFENADLQWRSEAFAAVIVEICPNCSTTSTGTNVKVSYSRARKQRETRKVSVDDSWDAERIADQCEELVDEKGDDKDVHILDAREENTLVICFDDE